MAAKKKTKLKHASLKKAAAKNRRPVKKTAGKRAKKNATLKKKLVNKKPSLKKAGVKTKAPGKNKKTKTGAKAASVSGKRGPKRERSLEVEAFEPQEVRAGSAGQSGDLQGLSNVEGADSESVDELIEEGNAFEADVVAGVERADAADEKEVRTHEVPEDDVPGEYLDKD
jgi:hypothetical protein